MLGSQEDAFEDLRPFGGHFGLDGVRFAGAPVCDGGKRHLLIGEDLLPFMLVIGPQVVVARRRVAGLRRQALDFRHGRLVCAKPRGQLGGAKHPAQGACFNEC